MPLSFYHWSDIVQSFSIHKHSTQIRNILDYLANLESQYPSDETKPYNVTLQLETRFTRSHSDNASKVRFTDDLKAPSITITEEEALRRYPLSYSELVDKLRTRYTDFKSNHAFHTIKRELEVNVKYCHTRHLDPQNPRSLWKKYYNTEILKAFDQHYTRKKRRATANR